MPCRRATLARPARAQAKTFRLSVTAPFAIYLLSLISFLFAELALPLLPTPWPIGWTNQSQAMQATITIAGSNAGPLGGRVSDNETGADCTQQKMCTKGQTQQKVAARYRMVALDLDGTLLAPDHKITDASVEYLRRLHVQGFTVAIATGRSPSSTSEVIRRLDLSHALPHSCHGFPLVCMNGACGLNVKICPDTGELSYTELFHDPVPRDVTTKVLKLASKMGLVVNYYNGLDGIYAQPISESHRHSTRRYTELTGTPIKPVDDNYEDLLSKDLPSKLLVFCEEDTIDDLTEKLTTELNNEAHVIRGSPPFFVEVLNKEVCKGHGLERMCEQLQIGLDETIAFGDGDNDIEFVECAGRGIAMKNARETLKKVADDITKWTNGEDGVVRTLAEMERQGLLQLVSKSST